MDEFAREIEICEDEDNWDTVHERKGCGSDWCGCEGCDYCTPYAEGDCGCGFEEGEDV